MTVRRLLAHGAGRAGGPQGTPGGTGGFASLAAAMPRFTLPTCPHCRGGGKLFTLPGRVSGDGLAYCNCFIGQLTEEAESTSLPAEWAEAAKAELDRFRGGTK